VYPVKRVQTASGGSMLFEGSAADPHPETSGQRISTFPRSAGATIPANAQTWWEDGYCVKSQLTASEREDMYRLRTRVFCRELRWVEEGATGLEKDEFDRRCTHLAVISPSGTVVATARVAFATQSWMLDRPFRSFLPESGDLRRSRHVAEISRLAMDSSVRNVLLSRGFSMADLLYKSLFNFCMSNNLYVNYAIVSAAMWRHMCMHGLTGKLIGSFRIMDDGVKAGLVEIDWKSFVATNRRKHPELLHWYTTWNSIS
jgi:N-acyl-L-homoserine lactone synthetase